jgi:hypothetical protein
MRLEFSYEGSLHHKSWMQMELQNLQMFRYLFVSCLFRHQDKMSSREVRIQLYNAGLLLEKINSKSQRAIPYSATRNS